MVKVLIGERTATISDYVWESSDPLFANLLNGRLSPFGTSPADPNPDLTAAQDAIAKFGGKILQADPVEYVEGRIY